MDIVETLGKAGVIPVIVIEKEEQAVPLAQALVTGGLPVLEVTFRTKAAAAAIAAIRREVPEAVVGAGTLLTPQMDWSSDVCSSDLGFWRRAGV